MTIGVIIQARTGSSRYPRKIYEDINGKTTLQRVLGGVTEAKTPHKIILAMPDYDEREFRERVHEFDEYTDDRFSTYFGSPNDLLERYFCAARKNGLDIIVRVTADCPLIQGKIIDEMLIEYIKYEYQGIMGSNSTISRLPYPDGTDVEIFRYWMLAETKMLTDNLDPNHPYREHVAPYMYRDGTQYRVYEFLNRSPNTTISTRFKDFSFDTPEDLKLIKKIADIYDKNNNLNEALISVEVD